MGCFAVMPECFSHDIRATCSGIAIFADQVALVNVITADGKRQRSRRSQRASAAWFREISDQVSAGAETILQARDW